MKRSLPVLLAVALLSACHENRSATTTRIPVISSSHANARTEEDFRFLTFGLTFHDLTNRVGTPDRWVGSGQQSWEYDLADGSVIDIMPNQNWEDFPNMSVYGFGQRRGTNWLWIRWPQETNE